MRKTSASYAMLRANGLSRLLHSLLLCACACLLGASAFAQTPPQAQWEKAGYGAGWHAIPIATAGSSNTGANPLAKGAPSGQPRPMVQTGAASTHFFVAVPDVHNPFVLWFDEHTCCDLYPADIVPVAYTITSSCSEVSSDVAGLAVRNANDIAVAITSWEKQGLPGPPWSTVDWWWGGWVYPRVPIEKVPLTCTFYAWLSGAQVANITLIWDPPPDTNMGEDCGDDTCSGGGPIDLTSGNTYIQQTDINVPGLNGGLQLVRMWNSMSGLRCPDNNGWFGNSWRSNYEERVETADGVSIPIENSPLYRLKIPHPWTS